MKRNFDYVTMGDYSSDMRELSETAASAIEVLNREKAELMQYLCRVVHAAGGRVVIPRELIDRIFNFELCCEKEMSTQSYILSVREK